MRSDQKHIAILDGMRGYAALAVVLTHMMGFFDHHLPVEAGILAVDLFFVMSGLVIEKSYGDALRDGSMSLRKFARVRLIRLYPLYVFGGMIGLVTYARHMPGPIWSPAGAATLLSVLTMLPQSLFGLSGNLFAFNNPSWSLCIELFGGLAVAAVSPRLRSWMLGVIALAALACFLIGIQRYETLNLGFNSDTFGYGVARFLFSYPMGILIWRHRDSMPRLGLAAPVILAIAMYFPNLPAGNLLRWAWVGIALPLGVVAALQIDLGPQASRLCALAGRASYPLYIIHVPVLMITVSAIAKVQGLSAWESPVAGTIALVVIGLATVVVMQAVEPRLRAGFVALLDRLTTKRPAHQGVH